MKTELINVSKQYGQTQVLHDINVTIDHDEFVVLIGPSGCGKTTLLKLIAGFEPLSDGDIMMDEQVVASVHKTIPPNKRNLSMVFQQFALWPHMNVSKHVEYPLKNHQFISKLNDSQRKERIEHCLKLVGLSDFHKRYPHELSGGQQQRVSIARAIAPKPGLLLMDEPLSSLDAHLKRDLRYQIKEIFNKERTSFLYVTHDQSEALSLATKVIVMNAGRIEQVGSPEEVYNHPVNSFVAEFVGGHNLIHGEWKGDNFEVDGMHWHKEVTQHFKEEGIIPLKPNELSLNDEHGIKGEVVNILFEGGSYEYTVETDQGRLKVMTHDHRSQMNDIIYVNMK
ncbi:ABC transporter ATP-binding protein [Abyssicoccus albus]|uniref:ABC transporter ATP-binding protein n=1 Tax=Abyssicoccus albus TaxID=1817405 RepID=UPI00097E21BB|nr:ABC transporter ATP-binding protein [Abyssicoccus albus]AQL55480.1 hypothetical protein BVH56_00230 [Abyssicoccus albus]